VSEYTLTPEEATCVAICEAIKKIWADVSARKGDHTGMMGAISIGLEGPEIQNAILKELYDLTDKVGAK
jgi:hypothetical protein